MAIGRYAGVGEPIGGGREPEAGRVDEIKTDFVGDHRRDHVA